MREGIWKLLSLSTKKDQVLRAVKNLMVCHARIEAYTAELRKLEEQIASQTGRRLVLKYTYATVVWHLNSRHGVI